MNSKRRTILTISLAVLAAGFLAISLKLPLWHMRMEAPQYREEEALRVNVFAGEMKGDLQEIIVLNQYIGVHIPEVLPQSKWLPGALVGAALLGLVGSILPGTKRRAALVIVSVALAGCIGTAVIQARQQMYDIGHKRDAHTKLARVQDFTPPFLGTSKIAQFTVSSWLGTGAYLIGGAMALQFAAGVISCRACKRNCPCRKSRPAPVLERTEALA